MRSALRSHDARDGFRDPCARAGRREVAVSLRLARARGNGSEIRVERALGESSARPLRADSGASDPDFPPPGADPSDAQGNFHPERGTQRYVAGSRRGYEFIDSRNSVLLSVALILSWRNSIESTGLSGARTLRRMYMRLSVTSDSSSSSRRVAERLMSMAG